MPDKIILADDSAFFVKTIDAPAGLSDADMSGFVRTWLENSSPAPVDKLRRCWLRSGNKTTIFAGSEDRVFAGYERAAVTSADFFVPAAAIWLICSPAEGAVVLESEKSLALIETKNGTPAGVTAVARSTNRAEDLKLLREFSGSNGGEIFLKLLNVSSNGKGEAEFLKTDEAGFLSGNESPGEKFSRNFSKKLLSALDIRDGAAMKKIGRQRRASEMKTYARRLIPALFSILIFFQAVVWFKEIGLSSARGEYESIEPNAKAVEDAGARLAELRMFTKRQIHPVEALAELNVARPDDIRFSRLAQTSARDIEIQGSAPTIGQVHAFVKSLKDGGKTSDVSLKTETARGEARFTLNVKLK